MLLLVLILVLIAFGLLVVALLTGGVLWAWVSVGVSVAAAAVLAVDWLQRRSAVRAGAEGGDVAPLPESAPVPPPHVLERDASVEPATEVIPVVPAEGSYGSSPAQPAADARRDERPDTRETVVMRAFAPPGSAEGPSGARGGIGAHGPDSSHSVTGSDGVPRGGEQSDGPGRPHDGDGHAAGDADPDSESTVKVTGAAGPEQAPQSAGPPSGQGLQQSGLQQGGLQAGGLQPGGPAHGGPPPARQDLPPLGPDGAPPEEPRDAEAAGLVAELHDEVLVVDELPRYHLAGCRSLAGIPVIPLPAREAVELGFSPCAWCSPDRTLSARHRAPAR